MADKNDVKFYLEKRKNKKTKKLILKNAPVRLIYSLNGKRLEYSSGIRIDADKWDSQNMKMKKGFDGYTTTNNDLSKLKSKIEDAVEKAKVLGEEITIDDLREALNGGPTASPKSKKTFLECYTEFFDESTTTKTNGTIKALRSSYNHLIDFGKDTELRLSFENINKDFYNKFLKYCFEQRNLKNNYTGKLIKDIKTFLNWATEKGYNTNMEYKKKYFKKLTEDPEIIFLTYEELLRLYKFKIESKELREIRDVFCFGCFTGMRFSDIKGLTKENLRGDFIHYRVMKTGQNNSIPLNPYSKVILERYKKLPENCLPMYGEQATNLKLKELFKLDDIKLDRKIEVNHFQGAKRIKQNLPLHDLVTFHISKKTFMTNFLAKGGSLLTAMAITGNKDFKTARRYYKVVDTLKSDEMKKVFG